GERAVPGHQHCPGAAVLQGLHDAAADRVVPDEGERAHGHVATEFVGHHRDHARDRFGPRGPCGGVGGVRVHHTPDVVHVPVDIGVRGGVGGGRERGGRAVVDLHPV